MSIAKAAKNAIRSDLGIIASWIPEKSRVLDLGCGDGELLRYLKKEKNVRGTGIEKSEAKVAQCIGMGLSVLQGDINAEVEDYPDDSFDYVILSQTLQQVYAPDMLLRSLLRIGHRGIVSFPNFSHWRIRLQLLGTGFAPKTSALPFEWYNTPNIRVITLKDFRKFSRDVRFRIIREVAVNTARVGEPSYVVGALRDLRADFGIYLIGRNETKT